MFVLITLATFALGGALGRYAVRRYFRARFGTRPASDWHRRVTALLLGCSAVLVLGPELPATLALQLDSMPAAGLVWLLRLVGLTAVALVGWAIVLTSRPVTTFGRGVISTVSARVPSVEARRLRRKLTREDAAFAHFPREWDGLVEYDRELSHRFLSYDHDLERAVSYPTMRDYTDERTRAALAAMFACDRYRSTAAPTLTRDVITTRYGRAVVAFAQALAAAEAHALRTAQSNLGDDERRRVTEAVDILRFVQNHTTTAPERDTAYRAVQDLLAQPAGEPATTQARSTAAATAVNEPRDNDADPALDLDLGPAGSPTVAAAAAHPWLDIAHRAQLLKN